MRISGPIPPPIDRKTSEPATPAAPAPTDRDDAVVVGSRARQAQDAAGRVDAGHAEQLVRIAASLADGSYRVDHEVLADRIIADEIERGGGR